VDQSRRVVASADEHGRTAFMFDGPAARSLSWTDGGPTALEWIWASESTPTIPHDKGDPTLELTTLFPPGSGSRFFVETFPPGFGCENDEAATSKAHVDRLASIGITAYGPRDSVHNALHATQTLDYGTVIAGRIDLELSSGDTVTLAAGDCYVQLGASHAWRNRYELPCKIAFVVIGAYDTAH
jgi:hypothetical protein